MKNSITRTLWALTFMALCTGLLTLNTGCKPLNPWQGDEQVTVTLGDKTATVNLKDLNISTYDGVTCVKLSAVVAQAKLATTANLQKYYFNFISSEGLDMSAGLTADMSLPTWTDIQKGYFYDDNGILRVKWDPATVPGADTGGYYNVTAMNGGTIAIVENNVTPPDNPWQGAQQVIVTFGAKTATVNLKDLNVSTYAEIDGVKLSDIVQKANLAAAANLKNYYFNFIASDGFDLSKKAISNQMSLPTWSDMQKGYLFDSASSSGLTIKWETGTTPGDFGRFYNCKLMDGGTIQILEENVL